MQDDLIYAYTRAEALADGVLVDVTAQAGNGPDGMLGGFTCPVAITAALWAAISAIPKSLEGIADVRGRLHDTLWMASVVLRSRPHEENEVDEGSHHHRAAFLRFPRFIRCRVLLPYLGTRKRLQTLTLHVGPGDDGAACVTLGFPEDF